MTMIKLKRTSIIFLLVISISIILFYNNSSNSSRVNVTFVPSIIWILFPLCTNPKAPYFLKIDSGATNSSFLTVTLNLVTQLVTDSIFSFPPKACRYPSGLGKSPVDSLDSLGSFEGSSYLFLFRES